MTFTIPSHLPRHVDVSSQILSKLDSVTFQSLDSTVASSWRAELDESIRLTKKRIHDRIHANLPAFEAQLASARSAQQRLRGLANDVDVLDRAVSDSESGLTPTLLAALRNHQSLAQASLDADVLHASLSHLSECKTQLERVQHLVESGDLPTAVPASAKLTQLLDTTPSPLGEATITSDIRSKLRVLTNRIEELLNNAYAQGMVVSPTDVIVQPFVLVPNSANPVPLSAVLSSLSPASLSAHMTTLRRDITAHWIDHSLDHPTSLSVSHEPDQFGSFVHRLQRLPSSEHGALGNLSHILEFINDPLFPCLPQTQRETFPKSLVKPLTTSIMTRLLIPSLPSKLDALPAFLELARNAVNFETKYVVGLLKGDGVDREIRNWVDNVCGHYERRRRQHILDDVRETILAGASRPKDTFFAELVTVVNVIHPTVEPAPIVTDNQSSIDAYSVKTSSSSSGVDAGEAWGFDDDIEESEEVPVSKSDPSEESEPDPNEAWGWNDDLAEEPPKTSAQESAETTPDESTEDVVWDDDPWADDSIANEVTLPDRLPVSPSKALPPQPMPVASASGSQRQPLSNGHPSTNGHVANHCPPEPPRHNIINKEPYPVSVLIRHIAQAVEGALREGNALASSGIFFESSSFSVPGVLIMQSAPLILDLYRALHPVVAASRLSQPVGRMQFSNDCHYLSEEIARVLKHEQGLPSIQERLEECKDDLKVLADSWFYQSIDDQVAALEEVLGDADGFTDTSDQERYDECEMVITRVLRDVRGIAHAWKSILPKSKYYTAVGLVVDGVLSRILDGILAISDITEAESHNLSELCRILAALEGLFVEDTSEASFVASYVSSWLKFSYLSELLEASMVDLTYLFDAGALVDFDIDELAMLVKALFADTSLRTKTIDKIMSGHPTHTFALGST